MINTIRDIKPEQIFLILVLIYGIAFLVIIPPFQVPDEPEHFYKSLYLTDGHVFPEKYDNFYGVYVPESAVRSFNTFKPLKFNPENKTKFSNITALLFIPLNNDNKVFNSISHVAIVTYSPIPYLAPSMVIFIGKLLNLSPLILMYLGRLANLLLYTLIIFMAIKLTPVQKWVFLLLSLMPMAVYLGSSLSADSFIIAISILTIALFFKLTFDPEIKEITTRDISILLILTVMIALTKPIYLLLLLLYFLIPTSKFYSKKKKFTSFIFMIVPVVLITGLWGYLNSGFYLPLPEISVAGQMSFILSHPVAFFQAFFNSISQYRIWYLVSFVGYFGWLDTPLPDYLVYIQLFTMFLVSVFYKPEIIKPTITVKQRLISLITFLMISISTFILMYISWTPVGKDLIEGVQGRYFIPIAPLFFLLFYNTRIKINKKGINWGIILFTIISLSISLYVIIKRFYIP